MLVWNLRKGYGLSWFWFFGYNSLTESPVSDSNDDSDSNSDSDSGSGSFKFPFSLSLDVSDSYTSVVAKTILSYSCILLIYAFCLSMDPLGVDMFMPNCFKLWITGLCVSSGVIWTPLIFLNFECIFLNNISYNI